MPRPRRNGVKRWRSRKARCGSSTKAGARSCSARRRLIEAGLDFADEGDVATDVSVKAGAIVDRLARSRSRAISPTIAASACATAFRIVIAGPPNAGKSSLLNALAKRDVAIVSEEAGTTRDVIEVHLDLGGIPVILVDTAGIREARGKVEAEGISRALARVEDADLVLWLVDATAPVWTAPPDIDARRCAAMSGVGSADLRREQDRFGARAGRA